MFALIQFLFKYAGITCKLTKAYACDVYSIIICTDTVVHDMVHELHITAMIAK